MGKLKSPRSPWQLRNPVESRIQLLQNCSSQSPQFQVAWEDYFENWDDSAFNGRRRRRCRHSVAVAFGCWRSTLRMPISKHSWLSNFQDACFSAAWRRLNSESIMYIMKQIEEKAVGERKCIKDLLHLVVRRVALKPKLPQVRATCRLNCCSLGVYSLRILLYALCPFFFAWHAATCISVHIISYHVMAHIIFISVILIMH